MKEEMVLIIGTIAILAMVPSACADAIIIDHTCTDLSEIPDEWIVKAKDTFNLSYGHTSHGSQEPICDGGDYGLGDALKPIHQRLRDYLAKTVLIELADGTSLRRRGLNRDIKGKSENDA